MLATFFAVGVKLQYFFMCYSFLILRKERVKLGNVCTTRSGVALRTGLIHDDDGLLAFQAGDFDPSGRLIASPSARIASDTVSARHEVSEGDVLFRSRGPNTTAWAAKDLPEEPMVALMPLFILRGSPDVDAGYLAWALNQPTADRYFAKESTGATGRVITLQALEDFDLTLPSITLQREVAAMAAAADEERELASRLAQLRHQVRSTQLSDLVQASTPRPDTPRKVNND